VEGPIDKPEAILNLIKEISSISNAKLKIQSINYSYVNGWDVTSDKTLIRFGNDLSERRFKNFKDTSNYLLDIGKIPSIIDLRYKDGVALNYGK
jgi:cell division septal protein FtsQ